MFDNHQKITYPQNMITRAQYMADSENLHESYYRQFVTDSIKERVISRFGIETLKNEFEKDFHLNGIPLGSWDQLAVNGQLAVKELREAGDGPTLAGAVCILKQAARIIVQNNV